ncbi:MAG: GMC family oxidoreductase [Myxococcota bacterium]
MSHWDVIIVGSGAGGGTLVQRLAPTGKRILLLERGEYLPREKENWDVKAVQLDGRYDADETWTDRNGAAFKPGIKYAVGGNTKVWGAATLRMRPSDFGEVTHAGGLSPAWPISYEEIEPYYAEAEHLWRVRGERGAEPTDGPASRGYRYPAIRHESRVRELVSDFARAGVHASPLPLGLLLDDERRERDSCIRCDTCDGFPCLVKGKADAQTICVEPALAYPNVTLLTGAKVVRLETDPLGRSVRAVEVERGGRIETHSADVVALACGAINSTAVLLRSASERHPDGLANASGLLGRNYMCHQNSAAFALSRRENHSVLQKTFAIFDFYHGAPDSEFPLGLIQPLNRTPAQLLRGAPPIPGHSPEYLATHSFEFWVTTEDLPDPRNRVRLGADGRIVVDYEENNRESHDRLLRKTAEVFSATEGAGFDPDRDFHADRMPVRVCSHQCGTARFGDDPKTSVLDRDCRVHELDNLYLVDASFFPSASAVNPTLTIIANALRVGDQLKKRLG